MTDIEKKALALLNESGWKGAYLKRAWNCRYEALCRAIEQHEAFRREVSEELVRCGIGVCHPLHKFILPKPVDPLVEALRETYNDDSGKTDADALRAAMKARGYEWTKIGDAA